MTHWYFCTACGQPTHTEPDEDEELSDEEQKALLLLSGHAPGAE
jgi:hypothetical protein